MEQLKIEYVDKSDLKPYANNAKKNENVNIWRYHDE